jgi:hypothetical protein
MVPAALLLVRSLTRANAKGPCLGTKPPSQHTHHSLGMTERKASVGTTLSALVHFPDLENMPFERLAQLLGRRKRTDDDEPELRPSPRGGGGTSAEKHCYAG